MKCKNIGLVKIKTLPKDKCATVLKSFAKLGFKKKFKSIYRTSYTLSDLNK